MTALTDTTERTTGGFMASPWLARRADAGPWCHTGRRRGSLDFDLVHTIIDSLEKQACDAERREPRPTADGVVRRTDRTPIAVDNTMHRTQPKDEADEAGERSFPGSDAPPWWTG
jgi:hypothetical protein